MEKLRISNRTIRWCMLAVLMSGILILAPRTASSGGPWYVATSGDDSNDCMSSSTPCASLSAALGKAASGDMIYVAMGTYTSSGEEVVRINKSVTFSGGWDTGFTDQIGASTIDGEFARRGIRVDFDSFVVLEHFVIQSGQFDGSPGIFSDGSLTLNYCTIKGNIDIGDWTSEGGGIRNGPSTLTLNHSTVRDNTSSSGAGIFNAWGTLIVNNSTISGNTASGGGGGINNLGGNVTLNSSTVSNNSADPVGGIHNEAGGSVTLFNSIVAGNLASYGPDCNGTFGSSGYNLIGNTADCGFAPATGDLTDMDPMLGALQDNGGSTWTHALLVGSPAIDAGTEADCPASDQRGQLRPLDGDGDGLAVCDVGAFEVERQIRVGFVTDELGVNDNGFNHLAYQGYLEAQIDFGFTETVYEPSSDTEYDAVVAQCAADNDLCLTIGFRLTGATLSAALAFPETAFTGIDSFFFEPPGNLRGVLFAEDEAGYLAGVVGGMMTTSDVIGGIGGMQIPPVEAYINGFRSGAMCHNPAVDVLVHYTGTFTDPGLGATTAGDMISQGADVIFAPAGLTGEGAVLAATQTGAWGIGVDTDWYDTVFDGGAVLGADKLLTSAMKLLGNAVYMTIDDYVNGAFSSGMMTYGLFDGGVGLAPFHETESFIPAEVIEILSQVAAGIINGQIGTFDDCSGEPPPSPEPFFQVRRLENAVEGWKWEMGVDVTLTIDDPDNGPGEDYSTSLTVGAAEWDPEESYVRFEIEEPFVIEPSHLVSMSDGTITKTHVVTSLLVTGLDLDTDVVSGTADEGAWIELWTCEDEMCYHRRSIADENGDWSADFSVAGTEPDELVYDFVPGSWVDVSEWDEDGDSTFISWNVPNPIIAASPNHEWVDGHGWQEDSTIDLYVDDDLDLGNGFLYTETGFIPPGEGYINFHLQDVFDLEAGQYITMTDGISTHVLQLSSLEVTSVDPVTDTVSGTAEPDSTVHVWIDACDPPCDAWMTADPEGSWSVSFSGIFEFVPGEWYSSAQYDDDGDQTMVPWQVLDPRFEANITSNWIAANEFPPFSDVTAYVYESDPASSLRFEATLSTDEWGHAWFDFWDLGLGELEPWNYVEVVGGGYSKDLIVLPLTLDVFDPGTGEISGTAPNGESVRVDACNEILPEEEWDCRSEEDIADTGSWSVTFPEFLDSETWFAAFITDVDGDSTMAEPMQPEPPPEFGMDTLSVALGDLDADGDLDAFVGNTGYNQVWFNEGDAFFHDSGQRLGDANTWAVKLDDLDGDGDLDAFVGNTTEDHVAGLEAANKVWLNVGDGTFVDTGQRLGDSSTEAVALGDIDGDGDVDAFVANSADEGAPNTVWLNDGVGVFSLHQALGDSASVGVALGDLDGDGDLDAFVGNMGEPKVWFNDGAGSFTASDQVIGVVEQAREVVLGDFDEDGDLDAFVISHFSHGIRVWLNDGVGYFDLGQHIDNPDSVSLAMDDLNNDSTIDAFVGNFDVSNQIYLNNGSSQFADSGAYLDDGDHSEAVALGDLDGDGDVDAFVGNSFGQPNKVWLNDGNGHFTDTGQRMNGEESPSGPGFAVVMSHNEVHAYDWPLGSDVTLTIDDPLNGPGVDYSDVQPSIITSWDPNQTWSLFQLGDVFTLMPDHEVTVTDGTTLKSHTVTSLSLEGVDPDTDEVYGTAAPSTGVDIWIDEDPSAWIFVTTEEVTGNWNVDFTGTFDIGPGTSLHVYQGDDDGDGTRYDWFLPMPGIAVFDGVEVHDSTPDASVTISIYDAEGMLVFGPESRQTDGNGQHNSHYTTLGCHFIEPGDIVEVMDDATGVTKSLRVSELQIEVIDSGADFITGRADPDSNFYIHVDDLTGGFGMQVTTDGAGQWTADFGSSGYDILPGSLAQAWMGDEDGDVTKHQLPNTHSPEYVRVLPFLDGEVYTVCPGQAAKIRWGWSEQSEANVGSFLAAIDVHTYSLDEASIFPSTEASNAQFGPVVLNQPNAFCGWPTTYVSWFDYDLYDLEPGTHSLASTLHLGEPVPETCGGGEVSGFLWENTTLTLNVVTGPNDADADDVDDDVDNCPGVPNRDQADFDFDGVGDKCDDDDDNDGLSDTDEQIIGTDPFNPDSDADSVLDGFDNCPLVNPLGLDADVDGCVDTPDRLLELLAELPPDQLADQIENSLVSKVENAMKSLEKDRENAAIEQLEAFINLVEAQSGKKISEEIAQMLILYAQNLIQQISMY